MGSIATKFDAFGWRVVEIDGHDHQALRLSFDEVSSPLGEGREGVRRPTCIVAHTVKGKGVDFMEDELAWHYKSPNDTQLENALRQVEA